MTATKDPLRILITGGRVNVDDRVAKKTMAVIFGTFGENIVFGDGKAPGYDTLMNGLAKAAGCATERYPIDASKDGDGDEAPKRRNLRMDAEFQPTHCLAMPGGPGTRHMWTHCFGRGLPVISVEVEAGHLHICLMKRHHKAKTLYNGPLA